MPEARSAPRRRRRLLAAGAVVLVAVAVLGVAWARSGSTEQRPRLAAVVVGTLRQTVSATGVVAPTRRADLTFGVTGPVTAVNVKVGDQVPEGMVVATVDAAALPSQVAEAKAAVAADRARLDADRSARASSAQVAADQAALESAQAQLEVAEEALAQAGLVAPFAGTVAAVDLVVGQVVNAGGSIGRGTAGAAGAGALSGLGVSGAAPTAQITVISAGSFVVNASVGDADVGRLTVGDPVEILPTGSAVAVAGTVESVGLVAGRRSGVASYPVKIAVTGPPERLRTGGNVAVTIVVDQLDDVLLVPSAAVRSDDGATSVTVRDGGAESTRPVRVGAAGDGRTQILDGVTEGTEVVLPTVEAPTGGGSGATPTPAPAGSAGGA